MDTFHRDDLKDLINSRNGQLVSIYLPTARAGDSIQQGSIRLKNVLREAEDELIAQDISRSEVTQMLKPAHDLTRNNLFWNHQADGLAIFLTQDQFQHYRLPVSFPEKVIVGRRFYIKPLIRLISNNRSFYVLVLSLDEVRLFECDRFHFDRIEDAEFPASFEEAIRFDDPERELQYHTQTASPSAATHRSAVYHGHGESSESKKKGRIERFLQMVDRGVYRIIGDHSDPLLLAGSEYLQATYRGLCRYNHLRDEGIAGNPAERSFRELHKSAQGLIQGMIEQERDRYIAGYYTLRKRGQASEDVPEVVKAARQGRVRHLFVAEDREVWGVFNPQTHETKAGEESGSREVDLLNLAAAETIVHGGEVYLLNEDAVPGGPALSAIYRY